MNVAAGHLNHGPGPTQLPASLHRWLAKPQGWLAAVTERALWPLHPQTGIFGGPSSQARGAGCGLPLSRAHPFACCFFPSLAEQRGEAGHVGSRVRHHPGCSSHVLAPPELSSLFCHGCQKAVAAFPQGFKESTLLRYTRRKKVPSTSASPSPAHSHCLRVAAIMGPGLEPKVPAGSN